MQWIVYVSRNMFIFRKVSKDSGIAGELQNSTPIDLGEADACLFSLLKNRISFT